VISDQRSENTVTVAMSGGVDSSVTLALLADNARHDLDLDVRAVFMRNWSPLMSEIDHPVDTDCEWERDWQDVQQVCKKLGNVPCEMVSGRMLLTNGYPGFRAAWCRLAKRRRWTCTPEQRLTYGMIPIPCDRARSQIDLSKEYWMNVFEPAIDAWQAGETPNPDVGCNRCVGGRQMVRRAGERGLIEG
jgi:tRNA-specific 2-thiouridylase